MRNSRATFEGKTMPLVTRLARMGRHALEEERASVGLRPRQLLVMTVVNERESVNQQALGETLGMDASNLVGLLNELEGSGLVVRRRDPADRRRHLIELTADGETTIESAHVRLVAIEDDLFSALSASERLVLHGLLSRVVDPAAPSGADDCQERKG